MSRVNKELEGLFCLDHNIKIYIPSTVDTDQPATELQQAKVNDTLSLFSDWFGGSTSYEAVGAWKSVEAGLVTEGVKIVESYATREAIAEHMKKVLSHCRTLKNDMNQEAISLEYDNRLYFI